MIIILYRNTESCRRSCRNTETMIDRFYCVFRLHSNEKCHIKVFLFPLFFFDEYFYITIFLLFNIKVLYNFFHLYFFVCFSCRYWKMFVSTSKLGSCVKLSGKWISVIDLVLMRNVQGCAYGAFWLFVTSLAFDLISKQDPSSVIKFT